MAVERKKERGERNTDLMHLTQVASHFRTATHFRTGTYFRTGGYIFNTYQEWREWLKMDLSASHR